MTLPWTMPLPLSAPVSGPPQWIEPIADEVISNAPTYEVAWTGDYQAVVFDLHKVLPTLNNVAAWFRTSSDGGDNFDAVANDYKRQEMGVSAGNLQRLEAITTAAEGMFHPPALQLSNVAEGGMTLTMVILWPFRAERTHIFGRGYYYGNSGPGSASTRFFCERVAAERVDAFQFFMGSGSNIASGRVRVRGFLPWGEEQ